VPGRRTRYGNDPAPPPPARPSATRLPQDPPERKPTDGGRTKIDVHLSSKVL